MCLIYSFTLCSRRRVLRPGSGGKETTGPRICCVPNPQPHSRNWYLVRLTVYFSSRTRLIILSATPASILRSSGSVGMAFMMWLIGAAIAASGMAVSWAGAFIYSRLNWLFRSISSLEPDFLEMEARRTTEVILSLVLTNQY